MNYEIGLDGEICLGLFCPSFLGRDPIRFYGLSILLFYPSLELVFFLRAELLLSSLVLIRYLAGRKK